MTFYGTERTSAILLETGELGWRMDPMREDDCLRPCVATVLQVPIDQVPDPRLDERLANGDAPETIVRESWQNLAAWLHDRGLRLGFHDTLPYLRRRWIGVCRTSSRSLFDDDCVVMAGHKILHDPIQSLTPPVGMRPRVWVPENIKYGISFDEKEQ